MKEAKRIVRLRLIKRIGIIGLITTSVIGIVFVVLSFVTSGNAAFSIRIDNPDKEENEFTMFIGSESEIESDSDNNLARTYVSADPMTNTDQTSAPEVEKYLASLTEFKEQQNFIDLDNKKDLALVYTVYLRNNSIEDKGIKYVLSLDGYSTGHLIDYFRVLIQTQVVGEDQVLNTYYGNNRHDGCKYPAVNYPSEEKGDREAISKPKIVTGDDGKSMYTSTWQSSGNDGYCINFNDYQKQRDIINCDQSIVKVPAGETVRLTYAAFFEGEDPDSFTAIPNEEAYLILSLHLGE